MSFISIYFRYVHYNYIVFMLVLINIYTNKPMLIDNVVSANLGDRPRKDDF